VAAKIVFRSVVLSTDGGVAAVAGFRGLANNIIEKEVVLGPIGDGGDHLGGAVGTLGDGSPSAESPGVRLAGIGDKTVIGSGARHHGVDVDPDRIG